MLRLHASRGPMSDITAHTSRRARRVGVEARPRTREQDVNARFWTREQDVKGWGISGCWPCCISTFCLLEAEPVEVDESFHEQDPDGVPSRRQREVGVGQAGEALE